MFSISTNKIPCKRNLLEMILLKKLNNKKHVATKFTDFRCIYMKYFYAQDVQTNRAHFSPPHAIIDWNIWVLILTSQSKVLKWNLKCIRLGRPQFNSSMRFWHSYKFHFTTRKYSLNSIISSIFFKTEFTLYQLFTLKTIVSYNLMYFTLNRKTFYLKIFVTCITNCLIVLNVGICIIFDSLLITVYSNKYIVAETTYVSNK